MLTHTRTDPVGSRQVRTVYGDPVAYGQKTALRRLFVYDGVVAAHDVTVLSPHQSDTCRSCS